jgi:hypothetical protein
MGGIHKQLQIGQTVTFSDQTAGFQIAVIEPEQPGARVVQIGEDFVVLDNEAAGIKTRIPVHLIASVSAPTPLVQETPVPQLETVPQGAEAALPTEAFPQVTEATPQPVSVAESAAVALTAPVLQPESGPLAA